MLTNSQETFDDRRAQKGDAKNIAKKSSFERTNPMEVVFVPGPKPDEMHEYNGRIIRLFSGVIFFLMTATRCIRAWLMPSWRLIEMIVYSIQSIIVKATIND